MTREDLAQQLKEVAEMLEKPGSFNGPEGPDVSAFVGEVLGSTDKYTTREAVGEFVSQIEKHGGMQALENCLHDSGWVKIGEEVPIGAVVSAIETMTLNDMREACSKLVKQLIDRDVNVNSAFFDALAEHEVYEEGSEQFEEAAKEWAEEHGYVREDSREFEDLAHEWADDNGLYDIQDYSFEDLADKFDNGEVRDFVVDYITQNL